MKEKFDEEKALTICEEKGYLNEKGLRQCLRFAKRKIIDMSEDIKKVCKYKGLTTKDD